jgi:hypothetical protein
MGRETVRRGRVASVVVAIAAAGVVLVGCVSPPPPTTTTTSTTTSTSSTSTSSTTTTTSTTTTVAPPADLAGALGCWAPTGPLGTDALVSAGGTSGILEQVDYVTWTPYPSTDGTCAGVAAPAVRAVRSVAGQSATDRCANANLALTPAFDARSSAWDVPALTDVWVCAWAPAAGSYQGTYAKTVTSSETCLVDPSLHLGSCGGGGSLGFASFSLVGPCDGTGACALGGFLTSGSVCGTRTVDGYQFAIPGYGSGSFDLHLDGLGGGTAAAVSGPMTALTDILSQYSPPLYQVVTEQTTDQRTSLTPALLAGCQ